MRAARGFGVTLAAVLAGATLALPTRSAATDEEECDLHFDSTFELIEKVIFENHGCTSSGCHDQTAQGGLVLLPGVAYDNLIDQPVQSLPPDRAAGLRRVVPARKDRSLLWLNVAAATMPDLWKAPLRPMPLALPPLPQNELDLLSMWFDYGAPREGRRSGHGRAGQRLPAASRSRCRSSRWRRRPRAPAFRCAPRTRCCRRRPSARPASSATTTTPARCRTNSCRRTGSSSASRTSRPGRIPSAITP